MHANKQLVKILKNKVLPLISEQTNPHLLGWGAYAGVWYVLQWV